MVRVLFSAFILVIPLAIPGINVQAFATKNLYYVDKKRGRDSNSGSSDQPWRTIQKAADTMAAGDTVIVMPGDYNERVQVRRSGAWSEPITFQASDDVTMNGFTIKASYISVIGFTITDTPDEWTDGWGIFVEGSFNVVENNYIYYATRGGIYLWDGYEPSRTTDCVIRNNRLERNAYVGIEVMGTNNLIVGNEISHTIQFHPNWANPPSWVDADGIRFFNSGHTIRKNYIHDITYSDPENVTPHIDCFQTWTDATHNAGNNIVIEQNLCINTEAITDNQNGNGFMLNKASNLLIMNNILIAHRHLNITNSRNITIINNNLIGDLKNTHYYPSGLSLTQTQNIVFMNNILYDLPGETIYPHDSSSKRSLSTGYNLFYRSDDKKPDAEPTSTDLVTNPLFGNPGLYDYHLSPDSPVIDAGTAFPNLINDYDFNFRPQFAGYDIGAFEFIWHDPMDYPIQFYLPFIVSNLE